MNIKPIMRRPIFRRKNAEEYLKVLGNAGEGGTALTSHLSFFQTPRESCDSKQATR